MTNLTEPQNLLSSVRPSAVRAIARLTAEVPFGELSNAKKHLLMRIAKCRFATEIYIEARAEAEGRAIVFVDCGRPVEPVPSE